MISVGLDRARSLPHGLGMWIVQALSMRGALVHGAKKIIHGSKYSCPQKTGNTAREQNKEAQLDARTQPSPRLVEAVYPIADRQAAPFP
jgi:hypothetical protein